MKIFQLALLLALCSLCQAENYKIDPTHSFIEWRIQHLGYSWLYGRFNQIDGTLQWNETKPELAAISLEIDVSSIDSNHAERDKHLRSKKYLDTDNHPDAAFKSTAFNGNKNGGTLSGILTLNNISQSIEFEIKRVGEGKDPWGGYRVGFIGHYTLNKNDFGYHWNLGPASETIELELGIEGIRTP